MRIGLVVILLFAGLIAVGLRAVPSEFKDVIILVGLVAVALMARWDHERLVLSKLEALEARIRELEENAGRKLPPVPPGMPPMARARSRR
ncbi:MAG TPA: hypothetical protein VKD90_21045 [Gemmataceae bacterium]|nr:hypothetical protein [Gemmataceae bacterium]